MIGDHLAQEDHYNCLAQFLVVDEEDNQVCPSYAEDVAVEPEDILLHVDAREVVVVHPVILFYLVKGALILDLKVLKVHLYYLWKDLTSFLLLDEKEDRLS